MASTLRTLIVEDRPEDAELIVLHLEDEGIQPDWQRVESEDAYLAALNPPPDLILADWSLPQFSGLRALRLLHDSGLDIPLIIVSGSIGEEAAVDALRQGASDYVLKDRLGRLGQAVIQAIENRRLRREHEAGETALRASEERYRRISEMISDYAYAFRVDKDRRLVLEWTAGGFELISGYTPEDLDAAGGWADLIHPDDRPDAAARAERLFAGERDVSEFRIVRKDGEVRWLRDHSYPVWDGAQGRVVELYGAAQDITETRRRAQEREALAAVAGALGMNADLDTLLLNLLDAAVHAILPAEKGVIALVGPADILRVRAVSGLHAPRVESLKFPADVGYAAEILTRRRPVIIPELAGDPLIRFPATLAAGGLDGIGGIRSAIAAPLLAGDRVIGLIGLGNTVRKAAFGEDDLVTLVTFAASIALMIERAQLLEVTQRQLAELTTLHQASRRLLAARLDPEETYTAVHEAVAQIMPCEAFTIVLTDETHGNYEGVYLFDKGRRRPTVRLARGQGLSATVISSGTTQVIEDLAAQPDVQVVHIGEPESIRSALAVPLRREGRTFGMISAQSYQPHAYTGTHRVLLETLAAQFAAAIENTHLHQQTQAQAGQMTQLMESVPEGVLRLDTDGRVLVANAVAERDLALLAGAGIGDIVTHLGDRSLAELLAPPPKGLWHEVKAEPHVFEVIARAMQERVEATDWVVVINDVTGERERRVQLQRQERLAAVGQLADGIAHDFRNLLTTTILYAHLTLDHHDLPPALAPNLRTIIAESHKATDLVQQLLDFSSRGTVKMQSLDLAEHVKAVLDVLGRTIPESVTLSLDVQDAGAEAHIVEADPGRLQQVLTNMALNARDAMPDGGHLRFAVSRAEGRQFASGELLPLADGMTAGDWVCLTISDTGSGMTDHVLTHLFEPFFTTKGTDKGTGLGLAQVYGIVRQHRGYIDVASILGEGTTFRIFLPAYIRKAAQAPVEETGEMDGPVPAGHGETILLVEDQALLLEATQAVLESLGYDVVTARNGHEALAIAQSRSTASEPGEPVALVITDLIMPGMGGAELLRNLRELDAGMPVLVMTGYAHARDLEAMVQAGAAGTIHKPFEIASLAREIRRALEAD